MPRVTVWKCPHTGKLFEDERKYQTHLKRLARERHTKRKLQAELDQAQIWWTDLQNREILVADLPTLIIEHQDRFWAEAARRGSWDGWDKVGTTRRGVTCPVPRLLEFIEFRLTWSDSVSNTHACPHNGVTNWGGQDPKAPRGYPGWRGRIEWIVQWPREWDGFYLGSDLFKGRMVRINTGTGGGGGMKDNKKYGCTTHSFGYDIEIFAADWPGMDRAREKELMWKILSTP